MKSYHRAWLRVHPNRTEAWLRERLADGFRIHHLDGDHFNDEPENLILIESDDHIMLHAGVVVDGILRWRRGPAEKAQAARVGEAEYAAKAASGGSWRDVAEHMHKGVKPRDATWSEIGQALMNRARKYADRAKRPWPPAA